MPIRGERGRRTEMHWVRLKRTREIGPLDRRLGSNDDVSLDRAVIVHIALCDFSNIQPGARAGLEATDS